MGAAIAAAGLRSTALLAPLGLAAGVFAALQLRNYPACPTITTTGRPVQLPTAPPGGAPCWR
jgi:hypothetical protein